MADKPGCLKGASLDVIFRIVPEGSNFIEFGSGESTAKLAKKYNVFSVEHDLKFIGRHDSTYLYSPLKKGWYDLDFSMLPEKYGGILIDGPPMHQGIVKKLNSPRFGFLRHIDKFNLSVPIFIDDTDRQLDRLLARWVEYEANRRASHIKVGTRRFTWI